MNKQRQKVLRLKVLNLQDDHCKSCEINRRKTQTEALKYCLDECDIGNEIRMLGCALDSLSIQEEIAVRTGVPQDLTVTLYEKHKIDDKYSDKKIREIYNMNQGEMARFKKANDLVGKHDLRDVKQEDLNTAREDNDWKLKYEQLQKEYKELEHSTTSFKRHQEAISAWEAVRKERDELKEQLEEERQRSREFMDRVIELETTMKPMRECLKAVL